MRLASEPQAAGSKSAERQDRLIAGYAALAVGIHVLEAGFPSPIPGIKPGLANVITLLVLLRHSYRMACSVVALRVLIGSLLLGSFLAPAFWLSAAGAAASLAALGIGVAWNRMLPRLPLSTLGLAVLAALAHVGGQFALAYHWFAPHPALLHLLPLLLLAALLFGLFSGWTARELLRRLPPSAGVI